MKYNTIVLSFAATCAVLAIVPNAQAATGELRLSGACVNHDGFPAVQSFELDLVTNTDARLYAGAQGIGFYHVVVNARAQRQGSLFRADFAFEYDEVAWTIVPTETLQTESFDLELGETAKFTATDGDLTVYCEATLIRAQTTNLSSMNDEPVDAMVDTPRAVVQTFLPNQYHCGVEIAFGLANRGGLISDFAAELEITTNWTPVAPHVEVQEYSGTLTITTDSQSWAEDIIIETKDHRTTLEELIRHKVFLGHPDAAATVQVLRCETAL